MLKKRLVTAQQLDGVIDLERLNTGSPDSIEKDAARFFDLTWPSEDIHAVLQALSRRFGGQDAAGTILAQAVKGLGKSHSLLLAYHLFMNPVAARDWTAKLGYKWEAPADAEVIVHKLTDRSLPDDALWLLIGQRLGKKWSDKRPPDVDDLLKAIGQKHLVLILDELERGIGSISNNSRRNQNLSFLQMLSEAANRDTHITLFAAIYDGNVEPGATLRRTPRIELRFRKTDDRASIVRHRLFADAESYDHNAARDLVRSYINTWKRFGIETSEQYAARMEITFPFLPDLVELVFTRITESGGFQGTRSALGLLGAMLDATGEVAQLMTAANCRVSDSACADRLQDLNPSGDLINCAVSNYRELEKQPFAEAIASATLLASLVPGGHPAGLSKEELVRHVVMPGNDPNEFQAALDTFQKFGTYFHASEGRYRFDREENEYAKVELNALRHSDEVARKQLITTWLQDVFRDTHETVVFQDVEQSKRDLEALSLQGRRFVLASRRLSGEERHALFVGAQKRNQIVVLEPRDSETNHLNNVDLLAYAKRIKAAHDLSNSPGNAEARRRYENIKLDESRQLQRLLRAAGLVYVRIERWSDKVEETQFEDEPLGQASSKAEVVEQLRNNLYPSSLFVEHLRDHLSNFIGQRVEQVDRAYRNTPGFPVPLDVTSVTNAVCRLVEDPARILGLKHQRAGGGFCGESVALAQSDLDQAELAHPWPATTHPMPIAAPGSTPSSGGQSGSGSTPQPAPTSHARTEDRSTPHCASVGELRQHVAARLVDLDAPTIAQVKFSIFADYRGQELSSLPAAYRGSCSGQGDLALQLEIATPGPLTKAQLEQLCEKLPNLPGATYSARMTVETGETAAAEQENME